MITPAVAAHLSSLRTGDFPAYVYDLAALDDHLSRIRTALPPQVELYYAIKANSDLPVVRTIAGHATGLEVASGGELAHLVASDVQCPITFGGPAKTEDDLRAALRHGVHRIHVESLHELRLLEHVATELGLVAPVMLRVNLPFEPTGAVLAMGGKPSQFGLTVADVPSALAALAQSRALRLHGIHTHLASGLAAPVALTLAADILDWAMSLPVHVPELTLGGGMAVDYGQPEQLFDWTLFGSGLDELSKLAPDTILRIEPGRAISAYCGYYVTVVNDVKHNFAILNGGTHQFRTPAAKSHSHPFQVVPVAEWPYPWPRPELTNGHVTLAGQLCTPKDILAANVPVRRISAGDLVVFIMAGAYGWNISHQEFLMHRKPSFHYLKT